MGLNEHLYPGRIENKAISDKEYLSNGWRSVGFPVGAVREPPPEITVFKREDKPKKNKIVDSIVGCLSDSPIDDWRIEVNMRWSRRKKDWLPTG